MLIASKFHDYYDTVSVYGIDKTCVYKRNKQELKGEFVFGDEVRKTLRSSWPHAEDFSRTKRGSVTTWRVFKYVIGYCGKLYPMILVEKVTPAKTQTFGLYSPDEVSEFFEKENINLARSLYAYFSLREFSVKSKESMTQFFEGEQFKSLEQEFHKNKCPVFVYGRFPKPDSVMRFGGEEQLVLNPKLKDFKFMKMKDPQTAFQDIFMFLSGVLGVSAPETVELSDKELAKKKGHGDKYSFRKPPGKRGKKQWR